MFNNLKAIKQFIVAVVLVLCLVLSVFTPSIGLIEKVSAEADVNLIQNPNFDSDSSGWTGFTYKSSGGENNSGCVQATNWGALFQMVELKANTTYTYKFYVGGAGGSARFYIQLDNPYSVTDTQVWSSTSTQKGFVEGIVTTTTAGKYWFFLRDWGAQYVIYDSFSLVEGDKTSGGGEGGNGGGDSPENIENYATQTNFNVSDWGTVTIPLAAALEANTTYEWSFKFSVAGGTQNAKVTIAGIEVFSGPGFTSNTVKSGEFTTGATAPTDKNIVFKSNGGGWFGVSELMVKKVVDSKPENIENYATQTSFNVSDWGTVTVPLAAALEANTTYEWSFKFSVAGGTQNAKVTIAGNEVFSGSGFNSNTAKSGEFTIGATVPTDTNIVFKSNGGGWFGVSDLVVKKVDPSIKKDANLLKNPNLDENMDGWSGFEYSSTGGKNNTGCVKSKNWDAISQMVTLKENTVYTFGFYVTTAKAAAKLFIQQSNPWNGGTAVWENLNISGDLSVTGTFTSTAAGSYWFFLRDWGVESAKYDSFFLIEGTDLSVLIKDGENLLANPLVNKNTDSWSGEGYSIQSGAHGKTNGVLLNKGGKLYQEEILLGNTSEYTYSLWIKPSSNDSGLKLYIKNDDGSETVWQGSGDGLKEGFIEGIFTPTNSGTYQFIIENTGNSDILLDTFALVKGTEYEPPVSGIIPGTEMQPEVSDYHVDDSFVSDNSYNIFKYGGFESTPDEGTEWNTDKCAGAESFLLDTEEVYNGKKSLKFTGGKEQSELRITLPVSMHTTYTFGAWVKGGYLSTEYPGEVRFGIVNSHDEFIDFAQDAKKHTALESSKTSMARDMRWHRVGFEFYTGDFAEVTFVIRGENALMWFDDMVLAKSSYCVKESEKVLIAPVVSEVYTTNTPSCDPKDNAISEISLNNAEYWEDTVITREAVDVSADPRNLKNEVLYYLAGDHISHSYYSRKVSLKADTDYTFTAFYRSDMESEASFGFYHKTEYESPIVFYVSASEPGDWRFITFNFNTKDYDELTFFIQDNGGNLVLDDVRLFEASKGKALDVDAQLKEMNSDLTPLPSDEDEKPANDNKVTPDNKQENTGTSSEIETEDSDEDESENLEYTETVEPDDFEADKDGEIIAGSGITELVDSSTGIKLYYQDGREIRSSVEFTVSKIATDKLHSKALALLEGMNISAFKLSLIENGEEILPNGRVIIEMPVPDGFDGEKCFVYRISDEGKVSNTKAKYEDGKLKFIVDRMGIFAVVQEAESNFNIWLIVGLSGGILLLASIVILVILLNKKKSKV